MFEKEKKKKETQEKKQKHSEIHAMNSIYHDRNTADSTSTLWRFGEAQSLFTEKKYLAKHNVKFPEITS